MTGRAKTKAAPPETAAPVPLMRILRTEPAGDAAPEAATEPREPPPAKSRKRRRKFVF